MVDVFISYRRAQRGMVEPIKNKLESLGLSVFFDIHGIDGGADFPTVIDKNLKAAKAVLACWSPLYFDQRPPPDWCMIECRFGIRKNALVPVAIERFGGDDPPADMHTTNYFDLTTWRGQDEHEGWQRTLGTLSRHLGRKLAEPVAGATAPPPQRAPAPAKSQAASTAETRFPELVRIPAGEFMMGSPMSEGWRHSSEGPQHRVRVRAFELGKYPITFAEWDAAIARGAELHKPDDRGWGRDRRPVIDVSWQDAQAFIARLNRNSSGGYRLPTEAEWEYACRAGTTTPYSTGVSIRYDQARFDSESTAPVGSYPANPFGLRDMHGNVWEWCEDLWHESYDGAPPDGSAWTKGGTTDRVFRGGDWDTDPPWLRSAHRSHHVPTLRSRLIGFRVARSI